MGGEKRMHKVCHIMLDSRLDQFVCKVVCLFNACGLSAPRLVPMVSIQ